MEIWIDSAGLTELQNALSWRFIKGVTTNPTLALRAGWNDYYQCVSRVLHIAYPRPVSCQLSRLPPDFPIGEGFQEAMKFRKLGEEVIAELKEEGQKIARISNNAVIKVPVMETNEWCWLIRTLRDLHIPVNTTIVFSPEQVLLAAEADANYVSVFVGAIEDKLKEAGLTQQEMDRHISALIERMLKILQKNRYKTKLLVASVRTKEHVVAAGELGVHVATVPFRILKDLSVHPLSQFRFERFRQDARKIRTTEL